MSVMRQDEVFAKEVFNLYLNRVTSKDVLWEDGNQNVPPDFYLSVGTDNYIVEVTALVEYIDLSEQSMSIRTLFGWCGKFVESIEREALKSDALRGTYYVSFSIARKDVHRVRKKLRRNILDFIAETKSLSVVSSTPIEVDMVTYCNIQKTPKPGNRVAVGGYPSTAKWSVEATEEAQRMIENAVLTKYKRLEAFAQPKILLLLAEYGFVDPPAYHEIAVGVDLTPFHTVFLVDPYNPTQSYVLHSENHLWLESRVDTTE